MLTFKQLMGFVLLATVVYLVSFLPSPRVVPTLVMLLGLGIACWRIGQPSTHASRSGAFRGWTISSSIAVTFGLVAFGWVSSIMDQRFSRAVERELGWRTSTSAHTGELAAIDASSWLPYSRRLLEQLLSEGKTVFVDFTADWCLTCQANEAVAISHPDVQRAINQKGIVQLRADKTFANPDADLLLRDLGNRAGAIPYYAVFPSNTPDRPRVLDGIFTSPEPILSLLDSADEEHRGL
jgi:thiol:disulfide interchange protein DsbD